MKYAVIENSVVTNLALADADFAATQAGWVLAGIANIGDHYDGFVFTKPPAPAAVIPDEVPMASARIVLLRAGITAAMVTNAIDADATTTAAQKAEAHIDFEFRTTVRRNSPLTLALGPALGLTSAQMDQMFIQAAAL